MERKRCSWKFFRSGAIVVLSVGLAFSLILAATADGAEPVLKLLKPRTDTQPFLKLLEKRASSRTFSDRPISAQMLSDLLWSACGINRPESGKRTVPTANNRQEMDVYAVLEQGIYLYDAKANLLKLIAPGDHRGRAGAQPFVKEAPLNLLYVADLDRSGGRSDEEKLLYAAAATGFMSENVYLYCASADLATVVRAYVDRAALAEILKLRPNQRIILAQTVGCPK